jgi:hypothetical protein
MMGGIDPCLFVVLPVAAGIELSPVFGLEGIMTYHTAFVEPLVVVWEAVQMSPRFRGCRHLTELSGE